MQNTAVNKSSQIQNQVKAHCSQQILTLQRSSELAQTPTALKEPLQHRSLSTFVPRQPECHKHWKVVSPVSTINGFLGIITRPCHPERGFPENPGNARHLMAASAQGQELFQLGSCWPGVQTSTAVPTVTLPQLVPVPPPASQRRAEPLQPLREGARWGLASS